MDNARRIASCLALVFAIAPAGAATLYKSVGPDGVIMFSDQPPGDNATLIDQRPIEALTSVTAAAAARNDNGPMNVAHSFDADESLMRANAEVDTAEHALALARRSMWSELEHMRLSSHRASASELERVELYKRGVIAARQNLMEVLRMRSTPAVTVASR